MRFLLQFNIFKKMVYKIKNPKMTIDKLARITANEFAAIRREMATKDDLKNFATKDDLKNFATKDDLKEFKEEVVREISHKVIQSNDKVISKLDLYYKDRAAHDMLHKRIEDTLYDHGRRIKTIENAK